MIYILWHKHGAFWINNETLFSNKSKFSLTINKLKEENSRSDEEFIKAFNRNYSDPFPPACMILEISSFGNLSSIYNNLKPGHDKREIANYFGVDDSTFASWLHSFTYVRNLCAHHSRLWNKKLGISPKLPLKPRFHFISVSTLSNPKEGQPPLLVNNKPYFLLCMIIYLLNIINPKNTFRTKLFRLFKKYPAVDVKAMGFPEGWESEIIWNWSEISEGQNSNPKC